MCYANRECMMYAEAASNSVAVDQRPSIVDKEELRKKFTGHLTKEDFDYFAKWDNLIDLEADVGQSHAAEAWLTPSETREKETGKCISSLVLEDTAPSPEDGFDDSSMTIISFQRSPKAVLQTPLAHIGLEPGCQAIISVDKTSIATDARPGVAPPRMHIVRGFLDITTDTRVMIRASRDDLTRIQRLVAKAKAPLIFRIDRDDGAFGTGTLRQNLINLFIRDTAESENGTPTVWPTRLPALRDAVVRLRPPRFRPEKEDAMFTPRTHSSFSPQEVPGCDLMDLAVDFAELNSDQRTAVRKVRLSFADTVEDCRMCLLHTPLCWPNRS
jgi:hypothetical protein